MNQENVERLIIDRALGELNPDAAALLDDWLAREPRMKADAAKIEETLALARSVLSTTKEQPIVQRSKSIRPVWIPWAVGMAACFVVGVGVGILPSRQPTPKEAPENVKVALAQDAGFWSARRLLMASPPAKPQGHRLI
jgi:anti-sigma factor RsiW